MTVGAFFAKDFFADMVFGNPKWDFHTLNFDSDVKLTDDKLASVLNSTDPNLRPFKTRGGKLIQYARLGRCGHPTAGQRRLLRERAIVDGYDENFYRLFMVPGMSHCAGGAGANVFGNGLPVAQADATNDVVIALDRWVEQGVAPDRIIATGFVDGNPAKGVAMTRPLCPYPQEAHYKGAGDTNDAASFVCQIPSKDSKK